MSLRSKIQLPRIGLGRIGLVVLGLFVLLLAVIGVLSMTRGTPVRIVLAATDSARPPAIGDTLFARTLELYTGLHLERGNEVTEMLNGVGTYPALWRDLRRARRTITVQMYYSLPGAVADTMAAVLSERARSGVTVLLLLDAFGSQHLTDEWRDGLRTAGVRVAYLRPLHWYTLHKAVNRSHVRVVTVDGVVGYTGGFGLADYWLGDGRRTAQWREGNVRFAGPAVQALQAAFIAGWAEATGELIAGPAFFPRATAAPAAGTHGVLAGLLFTQPTTGSTEAERFLALTISGARHRLWIANSYFVPDDDFRAALERAARRGVDVRILTVGEVTDVKTTRYAGRAHFAQLLRSGVRIYEYRPTMMHAKTIVADGIFGTIGSMNFDNRSLAFNNESNLVVLDSAFARGMEQTFLDDLRWSDEIRLATFAKRPWTERVMERGATLLSRIL